jgi:hypothetical protein
MFFGRNWITLFSNQVRPQLRCIIFPFRCGRLKIRSLFTFPFQINIDFIWILSMWSRSKLSMISTLTPLSMNIFPFRFGRNYPVWQLGGGTWDCDHDGYPDITCTQMKLDGPSYDLKAGLNFFWQIIRNISRKISRDFFEKKISAKFSRDKIALGKQ